MITVVLVLWLTQPWRPSAAAFQRDDPQGYEACSAFENADGAGGNVRTHNIRLAAEHGAQASNTRIRAAIDDGTTSQRPGDPVVTDLNEFRSACKAAGYRFS